LLKIPVVAIKRLMEKLGPLILGSAPVVSAIRKLVSDSQTHSDEARLGNLEKTMGLQAALNEKVDVQLKIVETLLADVRRSLTTLTLAVIGAAVIAILALVIAVLK
jgi:hypothetical protein